VTAAAIAAAVGLAVLAYALWRQRRRRRARMAMLFAADLLITARRRGRLPDRGGRGRIYRIERRGGRVVHVYTDDGTVVDMGPAPADDA
jgi:hypothetical protein